jgi:hypothetical protein
MYNTSGIKRYSIYSFIHYLLGILGAATSGLRRRNSNGHVSMAPTPVPAPTATQTAMQAATPRPTQSSPAQMIAANTATPANDKPKRHTSTITKPEQPRHLQR